MARTPLGDFLKNESAAGIVLMIAAVIALLIANSPFSDLYHAALAYPVGFQAGALDLKKDLIHWINDGLMAVFFLLVGAEIKREALTGELSSLDRAALPAIAALGGMVAPALVYVGFNHGDAAALRGWAIPAATDIAFALGVVSLLGSRVPGSLRVFLLALAIIDDLGAIVIIALFYTDTVHLVPLALAGALLLVLWGMNRAGITRLSLYLVVGAVLWVCVLKSGIHATLAGVALAFTIPLRPRQPSGRAHRPSPLEHLEHRLHPWVAFGIMPIFALANAGVPLGGITVDALFAPVPLGIGLGLFIGKQIGVFGASWLAIRAGLCRRPYGAGWLHLYGISILTGIGFTMSLFIGNLAFQTEDYAVAVRLGVLGGSLVSAIVGYMALAGLARRA